MRESNHELPNVVDQPELLKSYQKHKKLEKKVEAFGQYAIYSSTADIKLKELKKQKLLEMDRIMRSKN